MIESRRDGSLESNENQDYLLIPTPAPSLVRTPQAIRGVLCAMPYLPCASSRMMPPCPFNRDFRSEMAARAAACGSFPRATPSAADFARTNFMMGSPQPVHD